jgi:DHA1 family tetracycline resistance protein-like MFS transporter
MKKTGPLPILFVYVVVELLGYSLILPLLPYYAKTFGGAPLLIGLLGASNAVAQIIGAPFIGRLSDRYGRRPLLILGLAASLVGFVMLGLARSLALIFLSRIVDGLLGGNIALAQAYITDVTDEKSRAKGLGMIGAAFGIGFIIGPALGGWLSQWGYAVPAFLAAGLCLVNLIWVLAALPESLTAERRAALAMQPRPPVTAGALFAALRRPKVGPLLHTRLFYSLAFGLFQSSFALWALYRLGLQPQSTGYILAYVGLLAVLTQGLAIGRLTARFSEKQLALGGVVVMTVALLAWGFVPNVPLLLVVLAPLALAGGTLNVVLSSLLTKSVSPDEVGGTLGLAAATQSLTGVIAPTAGGLLIQEVGPWSLGVVGALIMAWLISFVWRHLVRGHDASAGEEGRAILEPAPAQP